MHSVEPTAEPSLRKCLSAGVAFGVLGLLLNAAPIELLPNVHLLLGPVFVLAAAVLFGPIAGGIAGAVSAVATVFLWKHPWAWIGFTLEGAAVGRLSRRRLPLVADLLFWIFGVAYLVVTYGLITKTPLAAVALVAVKQSLNGVLAALVVQVVLSVPAVRRVAAPVLPRPLADMTMTATMGSLLALAVILPTLALTAHDGHVRYRRDVARIDQTNVDSARASAEALSELVTDGMREVAVLAQELGGNTLPQAELDARLRRMLARTPDFLDAYVADKDAIAIAFFPPTDDSGKPLVGTNFADRAYVREVRAAGRPIVSDVFRGRAGTKLPLVVTVAPVLKAGAFDGYVLGAFDVRVLARHAGRFAARTQRTLVVDRNGGVVVDSAEEAREGVVRSIAGTPLHAAIVANESVGTYVPKAASGVPAAKSRDERRFAVALVPALGWRVIVEQPAIEVQRAIEATYVSALASTAVIVAFVALLAMLVARAFVQPITAVAEQASRLAAGDLDARVGSSAVDAPRELRALGLSFDRMAENVRRHVDELARASRAKDEFLSLASHELKTPLTALKMRVQATRRKANADSTTYEQIDRQVDRLNELIDRLLDASRVALSVLTVERRAVSLDALVRRVCEPLVTATTKHPIALHLQPVTGAFDELRLEQVVHNLLSNAIKYSPRGGAIDVRLERAGNDAVLTVEDRGVGVGEDPAPLFERFHRGKRGVDAGVSGLGVGLYVSREIVRAHGGRITLEDREGGGSVARVVLPLQETERVERAAVERGDTGERARPAPPSS